MCAGDSFWRNRFLLLAKSRSCVNFIEIVSISSRLCAYFFRSAQAKIVCQFHRDCVSISPDVHWSSIQIWKILTEVENCSERGDKGDKNTSKEFFKLIRKIAQRSEAKRSENGAYNRPGDRPGQPPGRPMCTTCTGTAWSTAWSTMAKERSTTRSIDCHELLSVVPNWPDHSTDDRVPVDQPYAFCLSWMNLDFFFLIWGQIQLGFLKFLRLFGYK